MFAVNKTISFWSSDKGIEEKGVQIRTEDNSSVEPEKKDEVASRNHQPENGLFASEKFLSEFWIDQVDTSVDG